MAVKRERAKLPKVTEKKLAGKRLKVFTVCKNFT